MRTLTLICLLLIAAGAAVHAAPAFAQTRRPPAAPPTTAARPIPATPTPQTTRNVAVTIKIPFNVTPASDAWIRFEIVRNANGNSAAQLVTTQWIDVSHSAPPYLATLDLSKVVAPDSAYTVRAEFADCAGGKALLSGTAQLSTLTAQRSAEIQLSRAERPYTCPRIAGDRSGSP